MSTLEIEDNGCMIMRDDLPSPYFEKGDAKFGIWISSSSCDENADQIVDNWYGFAEVGILVEFTPSQLLDQVEYWHGLEYGIEAIAKPSLQKMRAELVSMIERIDQMTFVEGS